MKKKSGFTILELAVTVIIIAVIAVVALPMYKHAILKSRFSTVMPMAKAVADAQEIYYLGNNQYALGKEDLDIAPVEAENTQVSLSPAEEDEEYIYVAAHRTDIPNVRYIMYQKNSPKFAGNIHCEADANDEDALWLCEKALHGTEVTGSLQGKQYKTFLLAGDLGGSSFKVCPENAVCNDEGNVTGCERGYYQEEQTCKQEIACDSAQEFIRTSCEEDCGEEVKQGTCNVKTGQWENYTVTQSCPTKPEDESVACDSGYTGTKTRSATCKADNSGWEFTGDYNAKACCNNNTKNSVAKVSCQTAYGSDYCGTVTYNVTCNAGTSNNGGVWTRTTKDSESCSQVDTSKTSKACGSSYTISTAEAIRTATCSGNTTSGYSWSYGNYDYKNCGCKTSNRPSDSQTCAKSGCYGTQSRTVSCNESSGQWEITSLGTCSVSMENGKCTYTGNCAPTVGNNCSNSVIKAGQCRQGDWATATSGCNNNVFLGGMCEADFSNSCNGGTFHSGTECYVWAGASNACNGGTFEAGSWCMAGYGTNMCNGTYKQGSWCYEWVSGYHCPAGSPSGTINPNRPDGLCWDGKGNRVACS